MFGLWCRGIHCAGCSRLGILPVILAGGIVYLITRAVQTVITTALLYGCLIVGAGMLITAGIYIALRVFTRETLITYSRPRHLEAPNGRQSISQARFNRDRTSPIYVHSVVQVLFRPSDGRKEAGQLDIYEGRD